MSLHAEIRERIQRYLTGQTSLDEFREWLAPRAWNVHKREDEETVRVANRIEATLSEFDHGDWTEEEVQQELTQVAGSLQVRTTAGPTPYVRTSTTWTTASVANPANRTFGAVQLFKSPKFSPGELEQAIGE